MAWMGMSERQKTGFVTNVPLLPKTFEIIEKYKIILFA